MLSCSSSTVHHFRLNLNLMFLKFCCDIKWCWRWCFKRCRLWCISDWLAAQSTTHLSMLLYTASTLWRPFFSKWWDSVAKAFRMIYNCLTSKLTPTHLRLPLTLNALCRLVFQSIRLLQYYVCCNFSASIGFTLLVQPSNLHIHTNIRYIHVFSCNVHNNVYGVLYERNSS